MAARAMGTAQTAGERLGMHWGFRQAFATLCLSYHPWVGGTDAGAGLGNPRSPLMSLALPQAAKLALGKDVLAQHPGMQEDAVVIEKGPGWLDGADSFRPRSCSFHVPFVACFY